MSERNPAQPTGTIADVKRDPAYRYVASHSVPVWPGGLTLHIVRHCGTDTLWARDVHSDDDTSMEVGDWYEVERKERVVVEYKRKAKP